MVFITTLIQLSTSSLTGGECGCQPYSHKKNKNKFSVKKEEEKGEMLPRQFKTALALHVSFVQHSLRGPK